MAKSLSSGFASRIEPVLRRVLRHRLGIAIASICLILIAVIWVLTVERIGYERMEAVNGAVIANSNLAMAFEEHTVRTLKGIDQALLFVRQEYLRQGARLNTRKLVDSGLVMQDQFLFIGVADERGDVVTGSTEFLPTNIADREYFRFHRQSGRDELAISKPLLGRIHGKWVILFSRRMNKAGGAFGGVVYATVEAAYFNRFYEQLDLGKQGLAMLVGKDGITRARRSGSIDTFGQDMRKSMLFAQQAKRSAGSYSSKGQLEGVLRYVSYRSLTQFPLIVAVGTSQDEVLAPFRARQRNYIVMAFLGSLLVAAVGLSFLATLSRKRRSEIARAHLASIVESSNDAITSRTLEGAITSWNAAAERMFGYTAAEAIGQDISIIIPPELSKDVYRVRAKLVASDVPTTRETVRWTKDHRRINIALTRSPIRNERGEVIGVSAILHDITGRKAAESSLLQNERRLRVALEERERVSRDLHDGAVQEIYAIGLGLEETKRLLKQDPPAASASLAAQIKSLNNVIRHIRENIISPARTHLTELQLRSELAEFANIAKSGRELRFQVYINAAAASRLSDTARLHVLQIAREAMSNSLRHSGGHSGIVSLIPDRNGIRLTVKDDGAGFDPENVRGQGNGLRNIAARVREVAGQLDVRASRGGGTEIIVEIPAGDAHAA